MSKEKTIKFMTGYKATDKKMRCREHQFKLGVWYSVEGELAMCCNGFHFCTSLPGVWQYYDDPSTRISRVFKCEAEEVLDTDENTGVTDKKVCRRIRLVEEIRLKKSDKYNLGYDNTGSLNNGHDNTGDRNQGARNSGDNNTGRGNTGRANTGDNNTGSNNRGDRNSGSYNEGAYNTADSCTGDSNSGSSNQGSNNSGESNRGNRNSGHYNAGNGNSGIGNACDFSSDIFAVETPKVRCFGKQTAYTRDGLLKRYPKINELAQMLSWDEPINFQYFSKIPGITPAKLKALHAKHISARKQK